MMKKRITIVMTLVCALCMLFAAACSQTTVTKFTVSFDTNGGTEIASVEVEQGEKITKPEDPSKAHYVFGGWFSGEAEWAFDTDTVTKDVTLTAKWTPEVYSVTFKNHDGTELAKENVCYGSAPKYSTVPEKTGDKQYSYTFAGWEDESGKIADLTKIDRNIVLTAKFTSVVNKYKVVFKNGNDVLKEYNEEYGKVPKAPETDPQKEGNAQYSYTFKGWDKALTAVTGDVVYTAEFKKTLNKYKVTFKNGDTTLKEETLDYGTMPTAPEDIPTKAADAQYTYTFKGWDKTIGEVTGDVVYTAEFKETLNQYKITFKNGDTTLKEETLDYGATPTAPETTPTKGYDSENHYTFKGWDKDISAVKGETVYSAQFNAVKHDYTVDSSDEKFDYILCSCGYKDESYSYDKTVTSARKELVVSASGLSLTIEGATAYESVEKMVINGSEISGSITSFELPAAVQSDTQRHGEQTIVVTVKDARGFAHELKVPVLLITKEIATMEELNAALAGPKDTPEYTIFGYYKLVASLGAANYNGIQNGSANGDNWANAGGPCGFRGTFDGNNQSISAIIYSNGIFGMIGKGAYIKNLTINAYNYSNGRTTIARTITEATLENITINIKSGSSNSYYSEGGVITALLSHSSRYVNVKVNSSSDLDMLFGFSYQNYFPSKANTFENCTVEAKSIGGLICITTADKVENPIVSLAGVEGLSVTLNKDAVVADNMTLGEAAEIELSDLSEITLITLENEEFTAYSFANGVLTINADAFAANQIGVKTFSVKGKNAQGLTVIFEITMTVELVATPVTLDGTQEIVLSNDTYAVDLGDYSEATVLSATLAGENVTYAGGNLTITEDFKAATQKHGNQTLVVTVEKDGKYYSVNVNVLVVTKIVSTMEEITAALTPIANDVVYGYYRLKDKLNCGDWYSADYTWSSAQWSNANLGFRGTFDGNGKTIKSWFWKHGLFGVVGNNAVIKNLTIDVKQYRGDNGNFNTLFGYSMMGATLENVTINVLKGGNDSIPTSAACGLLTCLGAYGNTLKNVNINAAGLAIDTLFGTGCWFSYPAAYADNTFENCTITAKSLIGLACTDNANKTVTSYENVSGLEVTLG